MSDTEVNYSTMPVALCYCPLGTHVYSQSRLPLHLFEKAPLDGDIDTIGTVHIKWSHYIRLHCVRRQLITHKDLINSLTPSDPVNCFFIDRCAGH